MSRLFIGDLHLGHKTVSNYRPFTSVEEHDEFIVDRWNKKVTKHDTVTILGDIAFTVEGIKLLERMKGKKYLIMGNHDEFSLEFYLNPANKVVGMGGAVEMNYGIISHIPVHESQLNRYTFNIHGHLHAKRILRSGQVSLNENDEDTYDDRYINCSCEQIDYTPIEIEALRKKNPIMLSEPKPKVR